LSDAPKKRAVCERGFGVELLTAAQMRAIEQAAIKSGTVTGLELMERAGQGVVEAIFEEWPELAKTSHSAVVLCGPGNNGGDGFVVARLLKEWGWEVEVFLYGDADKLPPDAQLNYERWSGLGEVKPLAEGCLFSASGALDHSALWVDALFGTGLTRGLSGSELVHAAMTLNEVSSLGLGKVIACDIPSGLCADSGRELVHPNAEKSVAMAVQANITVTFHSEKSGHRLETGPRASQRIVVKDIGLRGRSKGEARKALTQFHDLPKGGRGLGRHVATLTREIDLSSYLPKRQKAHKYAHGHALILSGPMGRSGAARLAARGALRVGAGVVTVAAPGSAMMECATQLAAIMLRKCDDADGLAALLEDDRINALCLGPGLGLDRARTLVEALGSGGGIKPRPTVLDADALTAFADAPEALFAHLHPQCVLTPHAGEFARIFPDISEKLAAPATKGPAYSKVDATREAAKRAGCVVLFKGPDTVIASPEGHAAINSAAYDRAAPWLSTAGSGDVLAGIITGLLARGFGPMQAVETGAWLHVEAALEFGPGLIAEDLPEVLPNVFRRLLTPDRH
jgi:ADP-dependent NAD(P)H-hydrate dehydratase / NAD(P)H-hydrate epimerase